MGTGGWAAGGRRRRPRGPPGACSFTMLGHRSSSSALNIFVPLSAVDCPPPVVVWLRCPPFSAIPCAQRARGAVAMVAGPGGAAGDRPAGLLPPFPLPPPRLPSGGEWGHGVHGSMLGCPERSFFKTRNSTHTRCPFPKNASGIPPYSAFLLLSPPAGHLRSATGGGSAGGPALPAPSSPPPPSPLSAAGTPRTLRMPAHREGPGVPRDRRLGRGCRSNDACAFILLVFIFPPVPTLFFRIPCWGVFLAFSQQTGLLCCDSKSFDPPKACMKYFP